MSVIKSENVIYNNKTFNMFHPTWLELSLTNFKKQNNIPNSIDGNMTIGEFIRTYAKEELKNCVVIKD